MMTLESSLISGSNFFFPGPAFRRREWSEWLITITSASSCLAEKVKGNHEALIIYPLGRSMGLTTSCLLKSLFRPDGYHGGAVYNFEVVLWQWVTVCERYCRHIHSEWTSIQEICVILASTTLGSTGSHLQRKKNIYIYWSCIGAYCTHRPREREFDEKSCGGVEPDKGTSRLELGPIFSDFSFHEFFVSPSATTLSILNCTWYYVQGSGMFKCNLSVLSGNRDLNRYESSFLLFISHGTAKQS
jgi:hypothetical protein